jgi:hypothetical protein
MSAKRKAKVIAAAPPLPLTTPKPPPADVVFRRKNRSGRLYLRLHVEKGGRKQTVIRAARVQTLAAAEEMLALVQRQFGKAV